MGRPKLIDRPEVLRASLAIADEEGLRGVTMPAVARRLHVTPMALYRHVADKDDLLDGVVELLLAEIEAAVDAATDATVAPQASPVSAPPIELADFVAAVRATARRHPSAFGLLLQRPAATAEATRIRDRLWYVLRHRGVPEAQVARIERLITTAVLGLAASEAAGRFATTARADLDEDYVMLAALLEQLVDPSP